VAEGAEHFLGWLVGWSEERRRGEGGGEVGGEREARKVRVCVKRKCDLRSKNRKRRRRGKWTRNTQMDFVITKRSIEIEEMVD